MIKEIRFFESIKEIDDECFSGFQPFPNTLYKKGQKNETNTANFSTSL
jgi:hypothetical protein